MHNRSEMVAVLGPNEALPYHIHTFIFYYSADIIPFNIKLINKSIFQIQKVCHISKFNIYLVNKSVFQSVERC
jgi:hypothetical protein